MTNPSAISVLIRTFNSAGTLDQVLAALVLAPGDEYIVVDSGSRDATLEIARRRGANIVQAEGPFNYSRSLNLGFRVARNPWVLVISSHCIPLVPDLMGLYRNAIAQFPADVMVGYGVGHITGEAQLKEPDEEKIYYYGRDDYMLTAPFICGNANTIYRRSVWDEVPFDESIRTAEDKYWLAEALKRNYRFAHIPKARALNRNQGSLRYMFKKGFSDRRALWGMTYKRMSLFDLAGGLKSLLKLKLSGKIDWANCIRYSAHTFGSFCASYLKPDNTPYGK